MRKTENRTQRSGAPAARRRGRLKVVAVLALAAVAALAMVGHRTEAMAQKDESVFNRLERAVKAKGPGWKLVQKDERKGAVQKFFTHDRALGEDEYVSAVTYELQDAEAAAKHVTGVLNTPASVPLAVTKVPGLGDEAYTLGNDDYGKKGAGILIARRGNIVVRLDTSSLHAAKRFARHTLDEIGDN